MSDKLDLSGAADAAQAIATFDDHGVLHQYDNSGYWQQQQINLPNHQDLLNHQLMTAPYTDPNRGPFNIMQEEAAVPAITVKDLKEGLVRFKNNPGTLDEADEVIMDEVKLMLSKIELVGLVRRGSITKEEQTNILRMLNSEDPESRLLAVEIIHIR